MSFSSSSSSTVRTCTTSTHPDSSQTTEPAVGQSVTTIASEIFSQEGQEKIAPRREVLDVYFAPVLSNLILEYAAYTPLELATIAAVKQNGRALEFASEELRADKEVVLAAVQQDGQALWGASEELRGNRQVVLAAVQQDGSAHEYASAELQGDIEVVLAAVKQGCKVDYVL